TPEQQQTIETRPEVHMRKVLTAGVAALPLGGAVAGAAMPAAAAPWHRGGYHGGYYHGGYYDGGGAGVAVAAGLLGLAAGAAIADHPHYYYGAPYYGGPGYYGYG